MHAMVETKEIDVGQLLTNLIKQNGYNKGGKIQAMRKY